MKTRPFLKPIHCNKLVILFLIVIGLLLSYCSKEPAVGTRLNEDDPGVYEYLLSNPDQYSEFAHLIEKTNSVNLLKGLKKITYLVPNNAAMRAYYKEKKVSSLSDFTDDFRQIMLRNHIVPSFQKTKDIYLGALQDTNALGDYLKTDFNGSDIILNSNAKIITQDILVAENIIQVIDHVIDPETKDIFSLLSENPAFSIFSEGLELTGIKDTLQSITYPYRSKNIRTRYTLLAVADTTYNRFGIYSTNDLINWCGKGTTDNYESKENPFYRYIQYHCLAGTFYLNNFMDKTQYYSISQVNSIAMEVTNDYKINPDVATNKYTGFFIPSSNIPAKNGVIHVINNLLPIPEFQEFIFETTDYPEFRNASFYHKSQSLWVDGQNSFSKIKFLSTRFEYFGTSQPSEAYLNGDYLLLTSFKWVELTTPEIPAGHYRISSRMGFTFTGAFPSIKVYIDDEYMTELTENQQIQNLGEVTWPTSGEHRIKIESSELGNMTWDYIVFTPLKE
jgi:uncharacterized surface protein with fasciclin (FAS1) repeats